jgi:hypothetical protein
MVRTLRVNGDRLWSRLMQMAEIGVTPHGGCNRQVIDTLNDHEMTTVHPIELSVWCNEEGSRHDSCNVSAVVPTAMVFVPCAGGLSHNEAESALPGDLEAGANVLLHAMLSMATM